MDQEPRSDDLDSLTREELIALVRQLRARTDGPAPAGASATPAPGPGRASLLEGAVVSVITVAIIALLVLSFGGLDGVRSSLRRVRELGREGGIAAFIPPTVTPRPTRTPVPTATPIPTPTPLPGEVGGESYAVTFDSWRGVEDASASGGGYRASGEQGANLIYRSTDATTTVSLVLYRGPDQGQATVIIDGEAVDQGLDLYAPEPEWGYTRVYEGLPLGGHNVQVRVLGKQQEASSGSEVRVDAIVIDGTIIEDDDPEVQYGAWNSILNEKAQEGAFRVSYQLAELSIPFEGTEIFWLTQRCPSCGQAELLIDGESREIVDLYHPEVEWRYPYRIGDLPPGEHLLTIRALRAKSEQSTNTAVVFDAFAVR